MIRFGGFALVLGIAAMEVLFRLCVCRAPTAPVERANWLHRCLRTMRKILRVTVEQHGSLPKEGLIAANHLSYLDVVVLGSAQPLVFISKSEVSHWPILGWLVRLAGTLFLRRDQKADVQRIAQDMAPLIEEGLPIVLFPEGTSTNGRSVLPFRSSLLAPAVEGGWPVTPVWIGYHLIDGSAGDEVCYWRDMRFLPHFLNLLSKRVIQARVVYGQPVRGVADRKKLARCLHAQVCRLAGEHGFHGSRAASLDQLQHARGLQPTL